MQVQLLGSADSAAKSMRLRRAQRVSYQWFGGLGLELHVPSLPAWPGKCLMHAGIQQLARDIESEVAFQTNLVKYGVRSTPYVADFLLYINMYSSVLRLEAAASTD